MMEFLSQISTPCTCLAVVALFVYRMVKLYRVNTTRESKAYAIILSKYKSAIGRIVSGKTLIPASEYLTVENWYAAHNINYRHITATASSLVGLGILGTFLGLAISLGQVNLEGKEQEITNSIQSIMGGINTAFYSSVLGMLTSLVFAVLHRQRINKLQKLLDEWCEDLDDQYYTNQVQLIAEQTDAIKSFGQSIGTNVGNQVAEQLESSMTELIETVTDCIKDQMQSAGKFMADCAELLKASSETLNQTTTSIKEASASMQLLMKEVDKSMSVVASTITMVGSVQGKFDDTVSELGDSAIQLTGTIAKVKDTIIALDGKFTIFDDAMTKVENALNAMQASYASLNGHNSKLDEQYKQVASLIGNLENSMAKQNAEFYKSLAALEKTIGEVPNLKPDIQAIFERINEGLRSYVDLLQNQTSGLLSAYTQEFTKACQSIQSTTGQLQSVMEEGTTNLTAAVKQSAKTMSDAAAQVINESNAK